MPRPLLLGHRGARAIKAIPENTLTSFDLALEHGCDGFEFDVRLTADNECLVCHDPAIAGREVAKAKRDEFPIHTTLDEVLNRYADKAFLDIELKVAGLEDRTVHQLRKHDLSRGFVISSFLPEVLSAHHRCDRNLQLGLICETASQMEDENGLQLTHVIPHYKLITPALISEWHAARKQVFAWTVNSAKKMLELQDWGLDAIISDDTQLLVATIGRNQHPRS